MNNFILILHSWLRWAVLLAGIWAVVKSYSAWKNKSPYLPADKTRATIFMSTLHSQLLIGIMAYLNFMSSIAIPMSEVMKEKELRFFAVEHSLMMFIAIVIAQIGSIVSKKAATDELKHKKAFIYFLIALLLILLMIPMGMMGVSRPWFRM
jgi:hypothetical protein